jgi:hypothetical protein
VAAERFLRPQEYIKHIRELSEIDGSVAPERATIVSRTRETIRQVIFTWFLRWVVVLCFLFTVTLSAIYMVERIVYAAQVNDPSIIFLVAIGLVALLLLYSIWAMVMFITSLFVKGCAPDSYKTSKTMRFLNNLNDRIIKRTASIMFGIDASDFDGGSLVQTDDGNGQNEELMNRMDKMESLLERALEMFEEKKAEALDGPSSSS